MSQKVYLLPKSLQETYFYQTVTLSESNPFHFQWCRVDNICTTGAVEGTSICHYDDGSPMYKFKCGTNGIKVPECLYGVASYARSKVQPVDEFCNGGSFFASIPVFYKWILQIM